MKLAESYKSYSFDETKAYNKGGKLYVKATCKCDRCFKGVYVTRVENGQPVPHPNAQGVCFKCGGSGIITKEVRLYTDEEYEKMVARNEKEREKRAAELEARMNAEAAAKSKEWLEKNGFSEDGITYIVTGDSYSIKEELKQAGFLYSPILKWHRGYKDNYEDRVIEIKLSDIAERTAWGTYEFKRETSDFIQAQFDALLPPSESEWLDVAEKGKVTDLDVVFDKFFSFDGYYGTSYCYRFLHGTNVVTWFTSKCFNIEAGAEVTISGTVKKFDEYKGEKQTVLTRCTVKDLDGNKISQEK